MRPRLALTALAAAVGLAGCGSSSLATPELRDQATTFCQAARKATDGIQTPSSPAGARAFLARGISVLTPELQGLRSLHPTGDVASVYATALGAFSHKLSALTTAEHQLARGDDPVITMKTLQTQLGPLEAQEDNAWRALEIRACETH